MRWLQALVLGLVVGLSPVVATDTLSWHASGKGGAVAGGGADAVRAGMRLLEAGGNAADAAAATLLALAVTDYGFFSMGGEVPLLIYDAERGEIKSLSGLGRAPLSEEAMAWYYEHGIPSRGSMKAAPVPGAIDLCVTTLRLYGTKTFREAVEPSLTLLDKGEKGWHRPLAGTLRRLVEAELVAGGTREENLVAARDRFYLGDIADELERWYIAEGSFLRKRDLAAHVTLVEDPVHVEYRGYTVYKCGPWTQGPVLCQSLRLLEGFDLKGMGSLSSDYIHVVTEALKLAFADRDEYYGDPSFVDVPMKALLSDEYNRLRRPLISFGEASIERRPGAPRELLAVKPKETAPSGAKIPVQDTTTCVVADRWGNVVAATPSCNLLSNRPGPLGITQGNRLRSLNTSVGHPNRLEPGKRPRITLTPTLVTRQGRAIAAISVAGGDLQDQTTLNVLLNHVEFGMRPAEAVRALRFSTSHQQNSFDPNPDREAAFVGPASLRLTRGLDAAVEENLSGRGHKVSWTNGPIAHPVMIYVDGDGTIYAAGDPKAKRHAAALP